MEGLKMLLRLINEDIYIYIYACVLLGEGDSQRIHTGTNEVRSLKGIC